MARRSTLRASDFDREGVVSRLHKAATEGRIASEELEERVTAALRARTYGELERIVADLPEPAVSRRRAGRHAVPRWALAAVRTHPLLLLLLIPLVAIVMAMILAATVIVTVFTFLVMVLGGRGIRRPPWIIGPCARRGLRDGRGGSYWA